MHMSRSQTLPSLSLFPTVANIFTLGRHKDLVCKSINAIQTNE